MGNLVSSTYFSTNDLPALDRFDAWRDKISVIFDVDQLGEPNSSSFEASVIAYQLSNLVVTDSRQDEQAYSLSPKRIRTVDMDLIQVGFYRSGGYRGEAEGSSIEGKAGDIQLLDLGRPMHSVEAASEMVCVFLPREILQDRIGNLDALHGADLRSTNGLLADYLDLLAKRLPLMADSDSDVAATATIEIIAACLRPTTARFYEAQSSIQDVLLLRAKRLIDDNLQSSQLSPIFLCRMLGISRRSLYRLFEPLDGVHQYILRRRLNRIKELLSDPSNRERISDVAERFGFMCRETFWRAFKRLYQMTPGDVRLHSLLRYNANSSSSDAGFDQWLKNLRV